MEDFKIFKLSQEEFGYDFLILATSNKTPLFLWDELEQVLGEKLTTEKTKILFDLTILNHFKTNRFVEYCYENGKIPVNCCSIVQETPKNLTDIGLTFFKENQNYLDQPFIPASFKKILLNSHSDIVKPVIVKVQKGTVTVSFRDDAICTESYVPICRNCSQKTDVLKRNLRKIIKEAYCGCNDCNNKAEFLLYL